MHRVVNAVRGFLGDRVSEPGVVAVSGGADSVALLRALLGARSASKGPLTVAHVNHRLRGNESDEDERFVERLAESLGVAFRCQRIDVSKVGGNLEDAGRRAR